MARLLTPESSTLDAVALASGVSVGTLERWRSEALSRPVRDRTWTAASRFEAVLTTAGMDEASRTAWCRAHGLYAQELDTWRQSATQALAQPEEARASPQHTERTARKTYRSRDDAKADEFDYIECFYNTRRRHSAIGYVSPAEFEKQVGLA